MPEPRARSARRMPWPEATPELEPLVSREWLVANGLGGYASGTVSGVATRRYHGVLVAALPAPAGRTMMLSHLSEQLRLADGSCLRLGGEEREGRPPEVPGAGFLREFRLEAGLPAWSYEAGPYVLEKRLFLAHLQNTAFVLYRLLAGPGPMRLELHPALHFRGHDEPVSSPLGGPYVTTAVGDRYEISRRAAGGERASDRASRLSRPHEAREEALHRPPLPPLRLKVLGRSASFTLAGRKIEEVHYRAEQRRGYDSVGDLWHPGHLAAELAPGEEAALVASTEPWELVLALSPREVLAAELERRDRRIGSADPEAHEGTGAELVLAADAFVIVPPRPEDAARAHAAGDEARSVVAGYPWFTDWGRDTMIALEGLALATGRALEAGSVLRTFAHHLRDGLLPNLFPEGDRQGLYHTADATLWYFHALARYLDATGDRETLAHLLPVLLDVLDHHWAGTRFGIGADPEDGLLRQGDEGHPLTWMDAKVDGWVVTPRRGKAVEINALWYNALKLAEGWLRKAGDADRAGALAAHAERARESFNRRFWNDRTGHLFDVVDGEAGDDPACRPNQVLAISLDHPVLDRERWEAVVETVRRRLLTPVGLRSLAPGEPGYQPRYDGDLRSRDAAYHQGTVWAWLIGPFVDAWLRLHPDDQAGARGFLRGFVPHLGEACIGSISEVFDAEEPYTPRGCVAQAWSVAEVLRTWVKTAGHRQRLSIAEPVAAGELADAVRPEASPGLADEPLPVEVPAARAGGG